ncbi:glycogen debranching enzyme [Verruconis gallopava]|uniref:Glycogen debranching enzyme n=1 Tax=Verruconis gallopava TaxID=253628 RepID=A0A0D2A5A0_9PEZI|nr:glycogen debranching enzyme [Verruconis gallopava]KIW01705.1 glycogen debranching enzyme [Verruconis gallopava]
MAPPTTQPAPTNVYLLPLTDDGAPDVPGGYILLPAPTEPAWVIRFVIEGTSSICREGSLWVNIPERGQPFERKKYREFKLKPNFNAPIKIDVPVYQAGAFDFHTTYTPLPPFSTEPVDPPAPTRTPTYYIDVSPNICIQGEKLPLNSLSIFSLISKFMGEYPTQWDKHLNGIAERGYNMVHFTPLNLRGNSNSPYSIADQLSFDPEMFPNGEKDIADLVHRMESQYGLLSLTDVVWNHTANNSEWLCEHPEAGYSVKTAPHLEPALVLDTALAEFSNELGSLGYPTELKSTADLLNVMEGIKQHCIAKTRLWEYYVCDIEKDCAEAVKSWKEGLVEFADEAFGNAGFRGISEVKDWDIEKKGQWLLANVMTGADEMGCRFKRKANPKRAAGFLCALLGTYNPKTHDTQDERVAHGTMYKLLEEVNLQYYKEYDADCEAIMEQLFNRIKYVRLDDHGPKAGAITPSSPLVEPYFTRLPRDSRTSHHPDEALDLVNNGWVWAADVLKDNAGPKSKAYLRREVIVWGDCVKLRYGKEPADNPYLWERIGNYTKLMAKYFHGFRIDNCHSTPLPLAQYMLDEARKVRPDIVCCAELFSGSEAMDFMYVEHLGLSCLIREAMQAWDTRELSRLVHKHAGVPIGSFETDEIMNVEKAHDGTRTKGVNGTTPARRELVHKIKQSPVQALFMDCTHDNETPAQKRDARDTLPNAALVAMCASACGSVFGYDEIYPKLIELVHEKRAYTSPYSQDGQIKIQAQEGGIGPIKKLFNQIHVLMGKDGYDETFIHHDHEYITIHRVHPQSRKGYFCIAHTAFPGYGNGNGGFPPVYLPGTRAKLVGAWALEVDQSAESRKAVLQDKVLRGLPSRTKNLRGVTCKWHDNRTVIEVGEQFPPGSVALFETWIPGAEHSEGLDKFVTRGAAEACSQLSLTDLNYLLYRCDPEERDATDGADGCYNVPGHGPLVYAGLQGWWSVLKTVVDENNLGHPICQHLRDGQWALDYCVNRLQKASKKEKWAKLAAPAKWMKERFDAIRKLPNFLLPRYFALTCQTMYNAGVDRCIDLMSDNVKNGQDFLKSLALVSVQCIGFQSNASLWPDKEVASMAAGLPHFSNDWARCWGRDIMISLPGLTIATGRYDDAKEHIMAFASVLKHGMIPNLLGSGKAPRYNSRDSIWFFLQCIQDYTKTVPEGLAILHESVRRRFLPYDDTWFPHDDKRAYSVSSTIEDVIQEALQQHATGQDFREHNAGPAIDSQMKDEGFNIKYGVDWTNGMVFGGNQWNCGTWMDKMGESEKAGSKGYPGTPRDGAAVEITGMVYSTVKWVSELNKAGKYKYRGVTKGKTDEQISFSDWADLIKSNFEYAYYIPIKKEDDYKYDVNSSIVNRRGIYKDLYRSGKEYEDYQLRPNFPIAMTVAPDLFDPNKALYALSIADKVLKGPRGMATLDPSDYNYRPYYNNSEDSTDFATAKGRNYHQGPEWEWPVGFFCRAMLRFDLMRRRTPEERTEAFQQITRRLRGNMEEIKTSPWAGLTELTNKDGAFCADSSPTQAWSAACLIDVFQDAARFQDEAPTRT